jgi:glycosyltransferase involved in cell wall biosynthesis
MKNKYKTNNFKEIITTNQKLTVEVYRLLKDNHGLKKTISQIENSKAYILFNFINRVRKLIGSKIFSFYNRKTNIIKTELSSKIKNTPISELVSIVIPTRNGGEEFKKNLTNIIKQKNIINMEILILDNNSTDGTREFAIKKGCRVFFIKEDEFGHGKTRAFGANEALGKYIIFTVQDANIIDKHTYSNLINFVKENNLSAASGYQKPKIEADSFAIWQNQYHYKVMNPLKKSIVYDAKKINLFAYQNQEFLYKRKIICIDDVIACYTKEVFEKFNFSKNIEFAEDAYLAQLILLDKKKIGITYLSSLYHSHNIDPLYAFKRAYVDTISLKEIFNQKLTRITPKKTLLKSQIVTIFLLTATLCISTLKPKSLSETIKQSTKNIDKKNPIIKALLKLYPRLNLSKISLEKSLIKSLSRNATPLIEDYSNYCLKIKKTILFEKLMANILGSYLAEISLHKSEEFRHKIELFLNKRV